MYFVQGKFHRVRSERILPSHRRSYLMGSGGNMNAPESLKDTTVFLTQEVSYRIILELKETMKMCTVPGLLLKVKI